MTSGCIEGVGVDAAGNPGELTIAPAELAYKAGADATLPCDVELALELANEGRIDAAYGHGGSVRVAQCRRMTLTVQP